MSEPQDLLAYLTQQHEALISRVAEVAAIPAPTSQEGPRAQYVQEQLARAGLPSHIDPAGSVICKLPGRTPDKLRVAVAAHLDTVFPAEVDVRPRRGPGQLHGPGVGDNSMAVAALLHWAQAMAATGWRPEGDLWLVFPVGEEGLGDLKGTRQFFTDHAAEIDAFIALDGPLGVITHGGIGSRRFKITVTGPGGHSWGDFGTPSAIHVLSQRLAWIASLEVPSQPRTTYNIGTVAGGTSVNTIAQEATALLDMRSVDRRALAQLEQRVQEILARPLPDGVRLAVDIVGDRPAGSISPDHPLVQRVREVHRAMGLTTRLSWSSTDSNIPLALGIPAVTIGIGYGHGTHTLDEWIETGPLTTGLVQLVRVIMALHTHGLSEGTGHA